MSFYPLPVTKLIVSYLSAFSLWLVFAAFISMCRRSGQCELCSCQQLRFWHHLPPNPLPRKELTFVCMCVHTCPPHLAIHHFSRLILISSPAMLFFQELAFDDIASFLPPALAFPVSVWPSGGRRHFSVFCLAWLRCWTWRIFKNFPGSYEIHGFLLQMQQETEQV